MNEKFLFGIYLLNAVILIIHEIDSAYWHEWNLFNPKDKNGINGFLIMHFPLITMILIGQILLYENMLAGHIISFILSASGIFAFFFHFYHIRKGRPEFNTLMSKILIVSTFVVSIIQMALTINVLNI